MSTAAEIIVDIPKRNPYGAVELKEYIIRYTYRAFGITVSLLLLFLIFYYALVKIQESANAAPKMVPLMRLSLENLPPEETENADMPPPPTETIINTGPAARAGNPVPVPDAEIKADLQEFATVDVMSRASAEGGIGNDLGGFSEKIDFNKQDIKIEKKEVIPDEDAFIPVEKQPDVDLVRLQKCVEYPELARKAGVEGEVLINVLVGGDGKVRKTSIIKTDNEILNSAALKAVKECGVFTPAIQNGQPIMCWVAIPIKFKLR